jgi:hypothetical protein
MLLLFVNDADAISAFAAIAKGIRKPSGPKFAW